MTERVTLHLGLLGARLVIDGQKSGSWMTTQKARTFRDTLNSDCFALSAWLSVHPKEEM